MAAVGAHYFWRTDRRRYEMLKDPLVRVLLDALLMLCSADKVSLSSCCCQLLAELIYPFVTC